MDTDAITILLIEDNLGDIRLVEELIHSIKDWKIKLLTANTLSKGLRYIASERVHIILLDLNLPDSKGLNTFEYVHKFALDIPIIIMSVVSDKEIVYQALKHGAQNYLIKGCIENEALLNALKYAMWNYYPA